MSSRLTSGWLLRSVGAVYSTFFSIPYFVTVEGDESTHTGGDRVIGMGVGGIH